MTQLLRRGGLAVAFLFLVQAASASEPPVLQLVSATPWASDETTVSYVVYDADDDNAPVIAVSDFAVAVTRSATAVDQLTWGRVKAGR